MRKTLFIFLLCSLGVKAQEFIPIWPDGKKPNSNGTAVSDSIINERIWKVETPGMFFYPANNSENTGTTILICPGGGYERLSHIYNGQNFARWYNTLGINVFVLKYRLPHQQDLKVRQLVPLQDAQRAMRYIRENAEKWKINPDKIGVMGISAGGHVAATLGTHANDESAIGDALDTQSFKPNFMVLLSPVITMGEYAHTGSRKHFLGEKPSEKDLTRWSAENNVSAFTPPSFIVHAYNDQAVNVQNSVLFYKALIDKKIESSLHVFPQGGHGIRLDANPGSTDLWLELLELWLKETQFLNSLPFR